MTFILLLSDTIIIGAILFAVKFWPEIRATNPFRKPEVFPSVLTSPKLACQRCLLVFVVLHPYTDKLCHSCVTDLRVENMDKVQQEQLEQKLRRALPLISGEELAERFGRLLTTLGENT